MGITPLLDFNAYRLKMLPHDIKKMAYPGSRQESGTPVGKLKSSDTLSDDLALCCYLGSFLFGYAQKSNKMMYIKTQAID